MATIKHYKVVAALPGTLEADALYLVRVGSGFDLYATNGAGTVVAYAANYQPGSANLTALAGLTGASNKAPYFTAAGAMAVYDLTVFGRSVVATADAAALRTLLGLGTAATRDATTSASDTTSERLWRTNDLVKQTSQKDTTAGRVMVTGAGGWMGLSPLLTGNDYNNDSEYCGTVRNDNNTPAVNYPPQIPATVPMAALNVRFNATHGWQLGVQTRGASPSDDNTRAFLRCEVGGSWSSWAELWHSGNLDNTESGWLTPTLVNSYTQGTDPVRYRRIGKFVVVTGSLRRSSPPTALQTICTLPAGYRPAKQFHTTVHWISDNLAAHAASISIDTGGAIAVGFLYTLAGTPSGAGGINLTIVFPVD